MSLMGKNNLTLYQKKYSLSDLLGQATPALRSMRYGKIDSKSCTPYRDDITETEQEDSYRVHPFGALQGTSENVRDI